MSNSPSPQTPSQADRTASLTRSLAAAARGDRDAAQRLMPAVYDELRALAASALKRERSDHTLQPTALVHEAFLRLVDQTHAEYHSRTHFFAIAAQMIRRVLVDHARRHSAAKRGGDAGGEAGSGRPQRLTLSQLGQEVHDKAVEVLALDEALTKLAALDERQARVVELRFFSGLSVEEAAQALGVSPRTVEQDWRMAKAWLKRELE